MTTLNQETFKKTLQCLRFKSNLTPENEKEVIVHFHGGYAYTFDDERVNIVPCPLEYSGTAPLRHMLASLYGYEDEVDITWKDGKSSANKRIIKIVNGSHKVWLRKNTPDLDVFNMHAGKKLEWHPLPDNFWDYTDLLEATVSKNATNFQLSSIHCSPKYFEAASENQICRLYHKLPDNFEFLFKHGALKGLSGAKFIARAQEYCYFKYGMNLVVAIRIIDEPYLKSISMKIKQEHSGHLVKLPVELLDAIKSAELFTDERKILYCTLNNGMFSIKAENTIGEYIARAEIDYTGDEVSFMLKADVLTDVLKLNRKCIITDDCIKIEDDTLVFLTSLVI